MTAPDTSWMTDAACRDKPGAWWFPVEARGRTGPGYARARRVCAGCPVVDQCLTTLLATASWSEIAQGGMFAGRTPSELLKIRAAHRRTLYGERRCDVCGHLFDAYTPTGRYCDDTCRATAHRLQQREAMRARRAS